MTTRARIALSCLLLLFPGSALAAVRRVPLDFATITAALAASAAGDTVQVAAGHYAPSTNGETFPLVLATDRIQLLGAGMDASVLDAQGTGGVLLHTAAQGGRISGFAIIGGAAANGGGVQIASGDVQVDHNRIASNGASTGGAGLWAGGVAAPWIHHNLFLDNFATTAVDVHALRLNFKVGGVFEHNLVAHTDGNGLLTVDSVTTTVRDNIFYQNGIPFPLRGRGICWLSERAPSIAHNLFFQNQVAALLWVNGGGDFSGTAANNFDGSDQVYGNLDLDPRFVNAGAGDYHLLASSPAVDAGDPTAPHDADGTVADIGPLPYLYVASTPPGGAAGAFTIAPNPSRGATEARFTLAAPGRVRADVLDVAGRLVRTLADEPREAGTHALRWDGFDEAGRPAAAGLYFVRVRTGVVAQSRPVVVIR